MEERRNLTSFEDSVIPTVPIDVYNDSARPKQVALHDNSHDIHDMNSMLHYLSEAKLIFDYINKLVQTTS